MKKITVALLYAVIFLSASFVNISTDAYDKKYYVEAPIEIKVEDDVIVYENESVEEQDLLDKQQEEIQAESYDVIQTSTPSEYVEDTNNYEYVEENYSINYGTYGRLYVSWYDVALYDYNVYTYSDLSLQEIVDNYDSAAFYASHNRLVIADHDTQGFNVLTGLYEGATAYIKFGDGSTIGYRLIQKSKGYNTGPDLVDTEGYSFFNMDSDLIMYTCYDGGIMVTLWSLM